jgi:large subunit ribosomal protein L11
MAKKIDGYIKLTVPAGKANPAPPIGPALGTPLPVVITVYADKSFDFVTKTPPASFFLKKFAKIGKGSSATKKDAVVGTVTMSDCEEIAKIKMQDLNANDIAAGAKIIAGTAESMGIKVIKG